jgi:hypothetical protein
MAIMSVPSLVVAFLVYPQPWLPFPAWLTAVAVLTVMVAIAAFYPSTKPFPPAAIAIVGVALSIGAAVFAAVGIYLGQLLIAFITVAVLSTAISVLPILQVRIEARPHADGWNGGAGPESKPGEVLLAGGFDGGGERQDG